MLYGPRAVTPLGDLLSAQRKVRDHTKLTTGLSFDILSYKSIMSVPSTTSYFPFDSSAPQVFSSTWKNNYFIGEWYLSHVIIWSDIA
jgi:hypothetical protein